MFDLLFPYLAATIATAIVVVVATLAYLRHSSEARRYEAMAEKLPDACRLENIRVLREQAEVELNAIRDDVGRAKLVLEQKEAAERWLSENRQQLLSITAEREEQERLRLQLERITKQVDNDNARILELAKELRAAEISCSNLRSKEEQLAEQVQMLTAQRYSLHSEVQELETSCAPLRLELAGIRTEIANSERELQHAQLRFERLSKQLDQDNARVVELAKEIRVAEISCSDLRSKEAQLAEQVRSLTSQCERLHAEAVELEESCAPLRSELAGIRTEIASSERELQNAQQRFDRSMAAFERQLKQFEEQKDIAQNDLRQVQEQLQKDNGQLLEVRQLHASLSAELQGLHAIKESLTEQIVALREESRFHRIKTGQDEETERHKIAELWQPAIPLTRYREVQDQGELSRLEKAEQHLQRLGLQFPRRVLWAFHTSLKVTDVSPLVVLAGISGTGKSELPRRYAEAMGVHFLNVPVQPRWDSPQDMFGFFNYMENRYRATELGRALIQMDPFHAEEGRGWRAPDDWAQNSLSKHLMLVLLDEMNLARVEYYFSEFLSRLEIRRGIRRENAADRRKAELGLEIGGSSGQSPVMNVFVDRNVLFVGTMNEDETTQTLSDKVVDRANVLRFGKPGKLGSRAVSQNGQIVNERLPYQTWQNWYRPENELEPEISQQVDGWISRLNDALTRIRRPFAFRTQLAIRAYVSNYPGRDPDSMMLAMSDQIEQKILPKLRGFDPADRDFRQTVADITAVLRELKDDLLISAISSASKGHQFAWMGVDRSQEENAVAVQ